MYTVSWKSVLTMDTYMSVISLVVIYGIAVSKTFARAKESKIPAAFSPGDEKTSMTFAKHPPYRIVSRSKGKGLKSNFFLKTHKRNIKRNDILQDSPAEEETFVCPEGYRKRVAGGAEFCTPTKTEQTRKKAETEPYCPDGQMFIDFECRVAQHTTASITCPDGSVKIKSEGQDLCINQTSVKNTRCAEGTRLTYTSSGWKCAPLSVPEQSINNKLPHIKHQSMEFKSGLKAVKEAVDIPECEEGKVAAMSHEGYICIDPVFPQSVCSDDRVPSMTSRGIQCVPCPYGQKVVGVKCESETQTVTEISCPEGLQPVQSAVGRVCQYIRPPEPRPVPTCPAGKQQHELADGQLACIPVTTCPPGHSGVQSTFGETRCIESNRTDESLCFEGEVFYEGACIPIRLSEKFLSETTNPCEYGHFLVVSNSGSVCKSVTDGYLIKSQQSTLCGPGTITTQTLDGFRCLQGELPLYVIPMCDQDFVIAKLGEVYECISRYDADLKCSEGAQIVRKDGGFVCKPAEYQEYCGSNEFYHMDQDGHIVCLSDLQASEMCGDGYTALKKDRGFVCKKRVEDVSCPAGFVLSLDHGTTICIEEGANCHGITEVPSIGCLNHLPFCQPGYKINFDLDIPNCALDLSLTANHLVESEPQPCDGDGYLRPCDLPADLLLSGCNPDCANGGTCVNGSCVCPSGITGHACHIDIDECYGHPCEHGCKNNFGSYQCECPTRMFLSTDGQTCTDAGCIPECLNNGECVHGQCRCTSGFEGQYCQTDVEECLKYGERLCQHRCLNTYGGYTCICPPGSRLKQDGRTCLNTTCIPECRNGGECRNHKCYCPRGFYGVICQLDVNECRQDDLCSQKCENSWGSYSCSCREGFSLHLDGHTCVEI